MKRALLLTVSTMLLCGHTITAPDGTAVDYSGWSNDGVSCCGSRDCRPTEWRFNSQTGREEIRIGETWRVIDESKVIGVQPTDEGAHVCTYGGSKAPDAKIRCIVRPGFGA